MGAFYNLFKSDESLSSIYQTLPEATMRQLDGIMRSALCVTLHELVDRKVISAADNIYIEASGELATDPSDTLGLIKLGQYYQSIGFNPIPSDYFEKYARAKAQLERMTPQKQRDFDFDMGLLYSKHQMGMVSDREFLDNYVDLSSIPMAAKISTLLRSCNAGAKHAFKEVVMEGGDQSVAEYSCLLSECVRLRKRSF